MSQRHGSFARTNEPVECIAKPAIACSLVYATLLSPEGTDDTLLLSNYAWINLRDALLRLQCFRSTGTPP